MFLMRTKLKQKQNISQEIREVALLWTRSQRHYFSDYFSAV